MPTTACPLSTTAQQETKNPGLVQPLQAEDHTALLSTTADPETKNPGLVLPLLAAPMTAGNLEEKNRQLEFLYESEAKTDDVGGQAFAKRTCTGASASDGSECPSKSPEDTGDRYGSKSPDPGRYSSTSPVPYPIRPLLLQENR